MRSSKVTLLVNPTAGGGRARAMLPQVAGTLAANIADVHLRVEESTSFADARRRAKTIVQQSNGSGDPPDVLIVMGGDGMANIGLNACVNTSVRLGVVPAGTGDDFARGMGLPRATMAAVEAIISGQSQQVDVMEARGALTDGDKMRCVGSVVSTGYDAKVNYRVNNAASRFGRLSYAIAALQELAAFKPLNYRLVVDGESRDISAMMVCVANAGYFGGGMWIAPQADVTDGRLNLTIVHPVGRLTLLRLLPQMYSGRFVRCPAVEQVQTEEVIVDGDNMYAMADGENLGDVPLRLRALPKALHLLGRGES